MLKIYKSPFAFLLFLTIIQSNKISCSESLFEDFNDKDSYYLEEKYQEYFKNKNFDEAAKYLMGSAIKGDVDNMDYLLKIEPDSLKHIHEKDYISIKNTISFISKDLMDQFNLMDSSNNSVKNEVPYYLDNEITCEISQKNKTYDNSYTNYHNEIFKEYNYGNLKVLILLLNESGLSQEKISKICEYKSRTVTEKLLEKREGNVKNPENIWKKLIENFDNICLTNNLDKNKIINKLNNVDNILEKLIK